MSGESKLTHYTPNYGQTIHKPGTLLTGIGSRQVLSHEISVEPFPESNSSELSRRAIRELPWFLALQLVLLAVALTRSQSTKRPTLNDGCRFSRRKNGW